MKYITTFEVLKDCLNPDLMVYCDIDDYVKNLEVGMTIEFIANVIRPSFTTCKETMQHCKVVGKIVVITNGIMKVFGTRENLLRQKIIVDVTDLNTIHEAEVKLANIIEKLNNKNHD